MKKKKMIDRTGEKYGRLTVLAESARIFYPSTKKNGQRTWLCKCSCGGRAIVRDGSLRSGNTRSCGCLKIDVLNLVRTKHGQSTSVEYKSWRHMLDRCLNANDKAYKNYGGRGIVVCERWRHNPENFLADMGKRPKGGSLDRIDNNGPYSPENCHWATRKQQNRNTRRNAFLTFCGRTKCISEWAEIYSIEPTIIYNRLRRGFSIERIFTQPILSRR